MQKNGIPDGYIQTIPEAYKVGDIVYSRSGERYKILSIGEKGYDVYLEYIDGPKKGKTNYIAEVNWLFTNKRYTDDQMEEN